MDYELPQVLGDAIFMSMELSQVFGDLVSRASDLPLSAWMGMFLSLVFAASIYWSLRYMGPSNNDNP